jgi:hypothetical protein
MHSKSSNFGQSKYHHYLPQLYLSYFKDDTGYLYVYDKTAKEIRKSLPKNMFGKNRLNTVTYQDGIMGDWVERMYSSIETKVAPTLRKVAESKQEDTGITYMDRLFLSMFVSIQFWRLPINHAFVEKTMTTNDLSFVGASLRCNGQKVPDKEARAFYKKMIGTDLFKKTYPMMVALMNPIKSDAYDDLHDWHFMYQDPGFHLTSDNPIIYKTNPQTNTLFKDFILPLMPGRVLVSAHNPPQTLGSFAVNMQQFHQAERYIAGNNQEYLATLAHYYERIIDDERDNIKEYAFGQS